MSKYVNDILNLLLKSCRYITNADSSSFLLLTPCIHFFLLLAGQAFSTIVTPKFLSSIISLKFKQNWDSHRKVCDSSYDSIQGVTIRKKLG